MRPVVNASFAPHAPQRTSIGYCALLGAVLAIGVLGSLIFGIVPGAEPGNAPTPLSVTSASAIGIDQE